MNKLGLGQALLCLFQSLDLTSLCNKHSNGYQKSKYLSDSDSFVQYVMKSKLGQQSVMRCNFERWKMTFLTHPSIYETINLSIYRRIHKSYVNSNLSKSSIELDSVFFLSIYICLYLYYFFLQSIRFHTLKGNIFIKMYLFEEKRW